MPCYELDSAPDGYDGSTYSTLQDCEDYCGCSIFAACQPGDGTYAPFCPEGCTLDEPGDAPPACVCCNGITGCDCQCLFRWEVGSWLRVEGCDTARPECGGLSCPEPDAPGSYEDEGQSTFCS
jgi:hypothetical protein